MDSSTETPFSALHNALHCVGLNLVPSPTKHRMLVATRTLHAGSTLLREPALAYIPIGNVCHFCLLSPASAIQTNRSPSLQRCSGCHRAAYCSVACQRKDWSAGHKIVCAGLKVLAKTTLDNPNAYNDIAMLCKVVHRLLQSPPHSGQDDQQRIHCSTYADPGRDQDDDMAAIIRSSQPMVFLSLQSHLKDPVGHLDYPHFHTDTHRHEMERIRALVSPALAEAIGLPPAELVGHLGRFTCNNFTVDDMHLFPIAEGTFPFASLFNHDCWPNCIVLFEGTTLVIRSLRPIHIGEEVCISYVDPILERTDRRNRLKEKYCFECCCQRCNDDSSHSLESIHAIFNSSAQDTPKHPTDSLEDHDVFGWDKLEWLIKHQEEDGFCNQFDRARIKKSPKGEVPNTITPPHFNLNALTVASVAFQDYLSSQNWRMAYTRGIYVLGIYLMLYPRYYPLVSVHAFLVAQCLWNEGQTEKTILLLLTVQKWVSISHGLNVKSNLLIEQVASLLSDALKEKRSMK
ncbi:hypothetical protein BASA50_006661 [Batrachochytrium salamandrivorans]|uniref:MYND-type domain-containing protein n=1 Tax=Batrachochytrium salamandrivorans TaxID=1357716 RepID=A0ABQ8FC85_9FUNG|nr:hypothetical protein BASA62_000233 [Batrachochytrium salamandrivorans]KAH6578324.1 hypothetical protein BASA61_000316 [Batrachochytrium salamandrivorans]KAH6594414.1 hypothetical protein BASA50_006661 [Batrachochytrium salamandrivorans]